MLSARRHRLLRLLDNCEPAVSCIDANRRVMRHALLQRVADRPVIATDRKLCDYLWFTMAHQPVETVRCLFLGPSHRLIRDELLSTGTSTEALIAPREVIHRALELGATGLILAHNHPSGYPTPSEADVAITTALARAATPLGITLHDHVILGSHGYASFRNQGLI